jgi:signal transduction histidine kinase
LVTEITDNGTAGEFQAGNGLTGIKERVAELNGSAEFNASPRGFYTLLMIPEPG